MLIPLLRLISHSSAALTTIHQRHGDLVFTRFFGKKLLFVANPDHVEQIFSQEAKGNVSRDGLYEAKKPVFGDGLVNSKGELWVNQRRLMQPFFNKDAVSSWTDLMASETRRMVNRWKSAGSLEINLSLEMKMLVQSIVSKILFGAFVNSGNQADLVNSMDSIMRGLVPQLASGLLANNLFKHVFMFQNRKFNKAVQQFADFVEQALNGPQSGNELISMLKQAKDGKTGYRMTAELLRDEAITLFLAGQDTTINTLIWFFYEIGRHEEIQQKVAAEIAGHKDDLLTPENLAKLTYTKAALNEALRRYPTATAVTRQPVAEDFKLGGYPVSPDTTLLISIYALHHNARLWEKPDAFYPEHFTRLESKNKQHRHAYLPFGGGIHNCIGRHLAELEMMIIIVSLMREFRFKTEMTVNTAISITMKPDRDVTLRISQKI